MGSTLDLKLTNIFIMLQNYEFSIVHLPGTSLILAAADYLSRLPEQTLAEIESDYNTAEVPEYIFTLDVFPSKGKELLNDQSEHRRLYLESLFRKIRPDTKTHLFRSKTIKFHKATRTR